MMHENVGFQLYFFRRNNGVNDCVKQLEVISRYFEYIAWKTLEDILLSNLNEPTNKPHVGQKLKNRPTYYRIWTKKP